jgi:tetratricopeptide (TPR) repeat protein/O-antigen ligase
VIRALVLLLPLLGIAAVDPVAFDYFAVKSLVLVVGCAVCVAIAMFRRRFAWTDISWALWLFVGVRGAMLLNSPMPGRAVRDWTLLVALVAFHHAACGLSARATLRRVAPMVFGAVLGLLAALALAQWAAGTRQASALFANRNFAAAAFAMLLPFALSMPSPRARWIAAGLGGAALFATTSRGGLLAAAAALALWFVWSRPKLRLPILAGLPALVLAAGLLMGESNTVKVRIAWYRVAAEIGAASPLLGTGAAGFEREYPPRRPVEEHAISGGTHVHAVHNDYLESWAEGGLLGLLAHLVLLGAAGFAARRDRAAACALLAFAVASLVDLPLRDPSLLVLAATCLALVARRRRRLPAVVPGLLLLALAAAAVLHVNHWRADREFGRALRGDTSRISTALLIEPGHPQALIARSRADDLERLIETWPHHAGAHYNRTRDLSRQDAIAALERILIEHDPHHVLTRVRLATLLMDADPLVAASVLDGAIEADPRPFLPWALQARIQRQAGRYDDAERFLEQAEKRSGTPVVRRERLLLEVSRDGDVGRAARRVPPEEVLALAKDALARGDEVVKRNPPPRVEREPDESAVDFAARVQQAKDQWAANLLPETRPHYRPAAQLLGAVCATTPTPESFELLARAARGLLDREGADRASAWALVFSANRELASGNRERAVTLFKRALRAWPQLADDPALPRELLELAGK